MRKIKISELPLYSSLEGLFTLGTDNQNRSVKVSLEFVEETTNEAAEYARTHTDTAVANAETATDACNTATAAANTATTNADAATAAAITAKQNADAATALANQAALNWEKNW